MEKHLTLIGHVQFAGPPARTPPQSGELNYPVIFEAIDAMGWKGWVGAEYGPGGPTVGQPRVGQAPTGLVRSKLAENRAKHDLIQIGFNSRCISPARLYGTFSRSRLDNGTLMITSWRRRAFVEPGG